MTSEKKKDICEFMKELCIEIFNSGDYGTLVAYKCLLKHTNYIENLLQDYKLELVDISDIHNTLYNYIDLRIKSYIEK